MHFAMTEKSFSVRFAIAGDKINISMQTSNVSAQEAIGLLEMAKDQLLDTLKKNRQEIFAAEKKDP